MSHEDSDALDTLLILRDDVYNYDRSTEDTLRDFGNVLRYLDQRIKELETKAASPAPTP